VVCQGSLLQCQVWWHCNLASYWGQEAESLIVSYFLFVMLLNGVLLSCYTSETILVPQAVRNFVDVREHSTLLLAATCRHHRMLH